MTCLFVYATIFRPCPSGSHFDVGCSEYIPLCLDLAIHPKSCIRVIEGSMLSYDRLAGSYAGGVFCVDVCQDIAVVSLRIYHGRIPSRNGKSCRCSDMLQVPCPC
jgi:hypothetical protein